MKANAEQPPKFDLISDLCLHLWDGWSPDYRKIKTNDTLVVAGNIHRNPELFAAQIRKTADVWKTVLFFESNQERRDQAMTDGDFNLGNVHDRLRLATADIPNALYLRDGDFVSNGVAVIGRPCEWDHRSVEKYGPRAGKIYTQEDGLAETTQMVFESMNRPSSLSPEAADQIKRHGAANLPRKTISMEEARYAAQVVVDQGHRDVEELRARIIHYNADPSIHTIVLATSSVAPALLEFRPGVSDWRTSIMTNTELDTLKDDDRGNKVKYWLSGRQTTRNDKVVNGIAYKANPLGGPNDRLYPSPDDYRAMPVDVAAPRGPAPSFGGGAPPRLG